METEVILAMQFLGCFFFRRIASWAMISNGDKRKCTNRGMRVDLNPILDLRWVFMVKRNGCASLSLIVTRQIMARHRYGKLNCSAGPSEK